MYLPLFFLAQNRTVSMIFDPKTNFKTPYSLKYNSSDIPHLDQPIPIKPNLDKIAMAIPKSITPL
jgi:hypothetical protein